METQIVPEILA